MNTTDFQYSVQESLLSTYVNGITVRVGAYRLVALNAFKAATSTPLSTAYWLNVLK